MGSFVLLSGPSCVGKGPLLRATKRLHSPLADKLKKVVLYNDREPRPGEIDGVDYNFVLPGEIQPFSESEYIKLKIREGNWQALRVKDVQQSCQGRQIGFPEAFHKFGAKLKGHPDLNDIDTKTVFLSPLSKDEVTSLRNSYEALIKEADRNEKTKKVSAELSKFITDVMRRKLLRRVHRQKGIFSKKDLEDVEKRAGTAYEEMKSACQYDYILPNHDGEDSDNWEQFYYTIGDARKVLLSFVKILEGREPGCYEKWPDGLLP